MYKNKLTAEDEKALTVPCPFCGVTVGEWCRITVHSAGGSYLATYSQFLHARRYKLATRGEQ